MNDFFNMKNHAKQFNFKRSKNFKKYLYLLELVEKV